MGNQDNWRKSAARRRDERAALPADAPSAGPARHKDKRRWCKGRVGREHTAKCVDYAAVKSVRSYPEGVQRMYKGWKVLVCTVCGKELAHYYPLGREARRSPPAWVTP